MRAKPNARKLKDKRLRSKESRCFTLTFNRRLRAVP
jgi:hypothetical protein